MYRHDQLGNQQQRRSNQGHSSAIDATNKAILREIAPLWTLARETSAAGGHKDQVLQRETTSSGRLRHP